VVRLNLALLLALGAIVSIRAQNQPAVRPSANSVRIDMSVSLDGRVVDDLKRDEVELLEDGVPQTIESFEHVQVGPPGAPSTRARVFVVFIDTYHTQVETSSTQRIPLIRFLDRVIGSDDLVAVMTPEIAAGEMTFGKKSVVISDIMQSDWSWARHGRADRIDPKETLYDACYPDNPRGPQGPAADMKARRREKLTLSALDDLVSHLGTMREERKAVLMVSEGWVLFKNDRTLMTSSRGGSSDTGVVDRLLRRPPPKTDDGARGGPQGVNRVECESDREALAALDHSLTLRSVTEDANQGNMTFYSVSPRGIAATTTVSDASGKNKDSNNAASRQDSLRFLADNTDGFAILQASTVDSSIARILDDVSSYYLVGYTSANTKLDGRFRSITVRVKREGAKVRARRGYRGRTADELVSSANSSNRGAEGVSAAQAALAGSNARTPFRIRASSWVHDTAQGQTSGSFWIVGELDFQTRRELAWTGGAQADIVVLGADGTEVLSRTVDVKASDAPLAVRVPETGGVAPGEYAVRVLLRSQADTTLSLTDTARVEVKAGSPLGQAILWRRGPTTGPQYLRTADPRYQRSDRLRLELATTSAAPATAKLLDRNGNPLQVPAQVSDRQDESSGVTWIIVDALLAPFAPGDYAVEVTQGAAKQVTGFRVVP
jgi:VWFA-related protein